VISAFLPCLKPENINSLFDSELISLIFAINDNELREVDFGYQEPCGQQNNFQDLWAFMPLQLIVSLTSQRYAEKLASTDESRAPNKPEM
jgi:hypothetical protein